MMDEIAELAFMDFVGRWPNRGVIGKEIMTTDMKQEYRRAFVAGWEAAKRSAALDDLGKLDGELLD